ncbi:MAG: tetratricopeptide repeat protein [Phycisphaerae bacterium]
MEKTERSNNLNGGPKQHYEIIRELGDCYTTVGRYEDAKNCYDKAALLSPDDAAPYVGLGVIAFQNELLDDADIAFRVACRLDSKCAKAYCGLGMVEQKRGNYEKAFDYYLKCLEIDADNLTALLGLFQSSCQMGTFGKVIYYLELYLQMHPADTSVMFTLAALYIKDKRFEQSKRILCDLLVFEPDNKEARSLLEEVEHNLSQNQ